MKKLMVVTIAALLTVGSTAWGEEGMGGYMGMGPGMMGPGMMGPGMMGPGMMGPEMMGPHMGAFCASLDLGGLGLSADALEALEAKQFDLRKQAIRKGADLQVLRLDLEQMLTKRDFDPQAAEKTVKQIAAAEGDLRAAGIEFLHELASKVSDSQWQQLRERRHRMMPWTGCMMQGGPMAPGEGGVQGRPMMHGGAGMHGGGVMQGAPMIEGARPPAQK